MATDYNAKDYIVKTNSLYESFIIFGQRANLNIFEFVNTHNNENFTMLRLGDTVINYESRNNGTLVIKIPEYTSVGIISINDMSLSLI